MKCAYVLPNAGLTLAGAAIRRSGAIALEHSKAAGRQRTDRRRPAATAIAMQGHNYIGRYYIGHYYVDHNCIAGGDLSLGMCSASTANALC